MKCGACCTRCAAPSRRRVDVAEVPMTPRKVIETQANMGATLNSDVFLEIFLTGAEPFIETQGATSSEDKKEFAVSLIKTFESVVFNGDAVLIKRDTMALIQYAASVLPAGDK